AAPPAGGWGVTETTSALPQQAGRDTAPDANDWRKRRAATAPAGKGGAGKAIAVAAGILLVVVGVGAYFAFHTPPKSDTTTPDTRQGGGGSTVEADAAN